MKFLPIQKNTIIFQSKSSTVTHRLGSRGWRLCSKTWSRSAFKVCPSALLQLCFLLPSLNSYFPFLGFQFTSNLAVGQPFQQKTFTSARFWALSKNWTPLLQSFMESNGTEIAVVWIYDYINADVQPATAPSLGQLPLWGRVLWYRNTALRFRRTACNLLTSTGQWKYSATYKCQLTAWLCRFSNSSFTSNKERVKLILKWHFI